MWGRETFVWTKLAVIGLLWGVSVASIAQVQSGQAAPDNEQIVREFVAAWSRLDPDELVSYFTEDGTYFNMPTAPVTGHDDLRAFITGFLASWDETEWEILNLLAEGDIVMVERMDRTVVAGRPVELPCFGAFEMENGKIKVWRDYFDLATYVDAISPPK
jgi:limonene-1,2-epoxide hydrolase